MADFTKKDFLELLINLIKLKGILWFNMKNFNLRFITSITMLLVIYFAFTNSLALISVLF